MAKKTTSFESRALHLLRLAAGAGQADLAVLRQEQHPAEVLRVQMVESDRAVVEEAAVQLEALLQDSPAVLKAVEQGDPVV